MFEPRLRKKKKHTHTHEEKSDIIQVIARTQPYTQTTYAPFSAHYVTLANNLRHYYSAILLYIYIYVRANNFDTTARHSAHAQRRTHAHTHTQLIRRSSA